MIKFFRKIRYDLMAKNKTGKYLKYAFGEIVLVVIGILIALSINNWNEKRKNKDLEKIITSNLVNEFTIMQTDLQLKADELNNSKKSVEKLMALFGKSKLEIQMVNTDSLLYTSLAWPEFNPTSSVLDDLIQSGRLGLITNTELRELLFKWNPTIEEAKNQYKEMVRFNNDKVFEFLNTQISFKNVDKYGMVFWNESSVFDIDNSKLFNQLYYENMLEGQLFFYSASLNKLKDINELIDNILSKSK